MSTSHTCYPKCQEPSFNLTSHSNCLSKGSGNLIPITLGGGRIIPHSASALKGADNKKLYNFFTHFFFGRDWMLLICPWFERTTNMSIYMRTALEYI